MTVSIEVTQSFLRLNQVLGISVSERINLCTYKQPVSDVIFYTAGQCAADVESFTYRFAKVIFIVRK